MKEDNKKEITQKLRMKIGSTALSDNKAITSVTNIQKGKDTERSIFLNKYENWVNQYIDVVEKEKSDKNSMANKHRIMDLSHKAKGWQEKIAIYLNNDIFKKRYIQLSMRLSDSMGSKLKA
ncbi:hypothetical protein [Ancylomarina sp. 16SWW S1-10-2]|uniref:hypothetical protein n=1 Tax=Ancylomarina sp. 16SWW S1-10-2 TaxID=2499681 RepID=UPI0012AD6642|nr:hypothetical protein [Ancylomarina sp. 16SWW S1-10-2]MRT92611.1 hypothetical protein [Ancylomarina sp. 16SWW S1-10-2]